MDPFVSSRAQHGAAAKAGSTPVYVAVSIEFICENDLLHKQIMCCDLRHRQAASLAYFDCFWIFAVLTLGLVLVLLLMKRSVPEKGAQIVSE
ncbi:MAG TPA: hypothetical protein VFW56_09395 [Bradyrhizobium sp.]|nr:hypothetical protein [Bradyrhizobium sp.]